MKSYLKDYTGLVKQTMQFMKKHWIGTIVINTILLVISVLLFWPKWFKEEIIDEITEIKNKIIK